MLEILPPNAIAPSKNRTKTESMTLLNRHDLRKNLDSGKLQTDSVQRVLRQRGALPCFRRCEPFLARHGDSRHRDLVGPDVAHPRMIVSSRVALFSRIQP